MENWETIYNKNAPRLIGICRRYVKDNQLAEDLMHDAFTTAINKVDTYSGKGSFEGWLNRITVNTVLLHFRNERMKYVSINDNINQTDDGLNFEEDDKTIESSIANVEFTKQELLETIDLLPNHHRMVFNLYVVDGYTHKEIAQMLNISPGTSKSHLSRARKKLQEFLFEKSKSKNKKRGLFFILFAPKENYIDKIYQNAFENFEVMPSKVPDIKGKQQWVNTSQKISLVSKLIGNKILFIPLLGVITAAVFVISNINAEGHVSKKKNRDAIKNEGAKIFSVKSNSFKSIISSDLNINKDSTIQEQAKKFDSIRGRENEEPQIIHQTIIKRDTIIKRITIVDEK